MPSGCLVKVVAFLNLRQFQHNILSSQWQLFYVKDNLSGPDGVWGVEYGVWGVGNGKRIVM
ncbi:MAG TPA: hypothetical protein DEA78_26835 [Cyanobacteria bacterium UBA11159]|nr:hypothetical protein [Cyanobacteria bacterium UBA11366]HBK62645.1 hypothetical protein [Cyanobacteria bacterium UBA11166]HBR77192.1 hypothetical protein [Cyanobacteria bacterium UBA11159]